MNLVRVVRVKNINIVVEGRMILKDKCELEYKNSLEKFEKLKESL